jgi:hypothetical protein
MHTMRIIITWLLIDPVAGDSKDRRYLLLMSQWGAIDNQQSILSSSRIY